MRDTRSFSHLGGYRGRLFELSGPGDPVAVSGARMSSEVFAALGVQPLLGRTFTQQEDEEAQQVAVLSYGMWQGRFHGDANVLGSKILLYRKPYTVIGVMPPRFRVSAQSWTCKPERVLASAQPPAGGIYRRQRCVVERSHGGALKTRHHRRTGAE